MTLGVTVGSDSSSKEDVVVVVARSSLIKSLSPASDQLDAQNRGILGQDGGDGDTGEDIMILVTSGGMLMSYTWTHFPVTNLGRSK